MKLYELTGQYKQLQTIDDMDPETVADTLEALTGEIEAKAEAIVAVLTEMDAGVAAIDAEIKRLQDRKKSIQNKKTSLRDYLKSNMLAAKIKKIPCHLFSITLAAGKAIAVIDDEDKLPNEYVSAKTVIAPDRNGILKALKTGEVIPGAHLATSEPSIRIK